jgi:methionyl-tRNA formyltransferase
MKPLRIVFMGSPDFAVPSLEKIDQSPHSVVAVVSNPDKRRGRRGKPVPTDVKKKALELGLPTTDVENLCSGEFHRQLTDLKPDLFVVVAFRILPESLLEIPTLGSINLHASLLPKYRGAAPIHWAVINGEKETGCTVFFLEKNVDAGKIVNREKTEIGLMETTGDLYSRLKVSGAELLMKSISQIADGSVNTIPQNHELATPAPKLFRHNTRIEFNRSALEVHNFIRGLSPFPAAWCLYKGEKMNIYLSAPAETKNLNTGELHFDGDKLFCGCADGSVEIKKLQMPGKKVMSGYDFSNGYDLNQRLE